MQCAPAPHFRNISSCCLYILLCCNIYIYIEICLRNLLWNCETKRPRQTAGCHLRCAFRSARGNPVRIGPGYSTPTLRRRETRTSVLQIPWRALAEEKVQLASPTMCRANLGEHQKNSCGPSRPTADSQPDQLSVKTANGQVFLAKRKAK